MRHWITFPQHSSSVAFDAFGVAYNRSTPWDDSLWDNWHFVEREAFPYYYNRREIRKKELLKHWAKIDESWDKELEAIQKVPPPRPDALIMEEQKKQN